MTQKIIISTAIFTLGSALCFMAFPSETSAALAEVQQQIDAVGQTVDTVGQQVQSVKEKGLVQTIWDNTIGQAISAIWQQITGIWSQIMSIFGTKA